MILPLANHNEIRYIVNFLQNHGGKDVDEKHYLWSMVSHEEENGDLTHPDHAWIIFWCEKQPGPCQKIENRQPRQTRPG